uniref:Uncharacterized protein n=1 Tax=Romanomermis culicivorax TaxID=13658 RepID=A0A915I6T1_ROMCU
MCNFDGGESGKTFAVLSSYLDNKMAMKMHTGCQMVKDLKKKRKKRKHRALVGENSVKNYRVEDSYDCHHGFKSNYEHCHHDLANLRAINIILGIEEPQ